MPFSFATALSGLRANAKSLDVTGNNIANANTTAFKSGSITFGDIFTDSMGTRLNGAGVSKQIGNGVAVTATPTNFAQGHLNESSSPTAAAIQGSGFFVTRSLQGVTHYTRAGDFSMNKEGYLVTPDGNQVQGYAAVDGVISAGAALSSIKIPIGEMSPPVMTTEVTLKMNLDSAEDTGAVFHAPVQVFDSKGVSHTLDLTFTKQADGSYQIDGTMDGNAVTIAGGAALTFDSDGFLTAPADLTVTPDQTALNGATLPSIDVNLFKTNPDGSQGSGNITNFAAKSAVNAIEQDGFAAGTLSGVSISPNQDGVVYGVFSSGRLLPIAQFALATFNSQDGLSHLGGNNFGETAASGQASIGTAGSGGRGQVIGNALEQSNVDIATEFTDLIIAQRSFQANSRVITTISQTLQELIQSV